MDKISLFCFQSKKISQILSISNQNKNVNSNNGTFTLQQFVKEKTWRPPISVVFQLLQLLVLLEQANQNQLQNQDGCFLVKLSVPTLCRLVFILVNFYTSSLKSFWCIYTRKARGLYETICLLPLSLRIVFYY